MNLYFILLFNFTVYLPTLYDFHFDGTQKKWVPWSSMVSKYIHNPDMKFIDILGKAAYFFFLLLLCIAVPSSPTFSLY